MAKDIGAPTPQSENPSPWPASKQVSVILPAASTEQLPTPDQSEGVMVNGLRIVEGIPPDGRGKRLTWEEVDVLVRLCMERTVENEIQTRPKKWWSETSDLLFARTGRSYSWQSCKRRMQQLVYACRVHRDGITNHLDYEDSCLQRDLRQLPHDLCSEMVEWMNKTTVPSQQVLVDKTKAIDAKRAERVLERQREGGEKQQERDYHKRKHDRVWKWLSSLPPPGEMLSALDDGARTERGRNAGSGQRDRSRSPCREATKYRQRSPLSRREPQPTSTPTGKIERYFEPDHPRDSREKDRVNNQQARQPLTKNDPKNMTPAERSDLAMQLEDTVDDLADNFMANHMYPLVRSTYPSYNEEARNKHEAVNLACYALFRNMAKVTVELLAAAGLPTPPYPVD
ncbi:uncharacterized protein ACHE_11832A [Aspergillus chevalieri]|uniref:Uncharacterized protein n=1 Tax=Aspergillus chevalieri TaxID=182096 RepID=A0A7R7VGQ4_ASPCH|nr:uncharacterized protein ACHE_11832A [Aspergillus chevalieri]BCR84430.1 hypothetical protein ACHE_11832A [Aspergillus chevalieri]